MKESFKEHSAYKNKDLEIKTPEELKKAKKKAGVTTHEKAMQRAEKFGVETKDYELVDKARTKQETKLEQLENSIGEQDWKEIKSDLEYHRQNKLWGIFLKYVNDIKAFAPEKVSELNITEQEFNEIDSELFSELKKLRKGEHSEAFSLAADMKILFPEKASKFNIAKEELEELRDEQKQAIKEKMPWPFVQHSVEIKILDPQMDLNLTKRNLKAITNRLKEDKKKEDWSSFVSFAAKAKILYPQINLNLTEQEWQKIMHTAEKEKEEKYWSEFASSIADIKILAAEDVKVTDKGIETLNTPRIEKNKE